MHKGPYHKRLSPVDGHTIRNHPLYVLWNNIFQRCENPDDASYKDYGGRGIHCCKRWYRFENFLADMGDRPSPKHSLDRRDNDKGYEPGNVRWATDSEQALNRRRFKNNTSGQTGVRRHKNSFIARMDFEGVRYIIGYFATQKQAVDARLFFEKLFAMNRVIAVASLPTNAARINSQTGHRGINPHLDGGFVVRITVNRERIYVGYFQTLDEAINERDRAIAKATKRT